MAENGSGLWQDGKYLVVDLRSHVFPDRCLMTNEEVPPGARTLLELKTTGVPADELATIEGVQVASSHRPVQVTRLGQGNRVTMGLSIPLSEQWQKKSKSQIGMWVAGLGIAICVLSIGAVIPLSTVEDSPAFLINAGIIAAGIVITIAGFIMLTVQSSRLLPLKKIEDGKVWLGRADEGFLRNLPVFRESRELLARRCKRAGFAKWATLGAGGGFLVASLCGVAVFGSILAELRASQSWPTTDAKIIFSSMHKQSRFVKRRGWITYYDLDLNYKYTVDGQEYHNTALRIEGNELGDNEREAQGEAFQYESGKTVPVHYNPRNPQRAVLDVSPDGVGVYVGVWLFGLAGLVALVLFGVSWWQKGQQARLQERLASVES